MAFGIGIESEIVKSYQKESKKKQMPIACGCWFTSAGQAIPNKIKYKDENEEIQTADHITVLHSEQHHYSGIISFEYLCSIPIQGLRIEVRLIFYPETGKWVMEY